MKNLIIFVLTICSFLSYGQNEAKQIERKVFVIGFEIVGMSSAYLIVIKKYLSSKLKAVAVFLI